ncbi:universal stress protein [Niallia circulans]|jgi:nucleotide-binding universal stress UspA family protein|uniref:Universal stress protein n=1 Tax=Niallia circulans TaxID=1397 RepID=A0A0J1IKF8_NIACI|nr:universal stress protein [Niallia circulans]KLV26434.1 universal stress protein UspA [Niallia circulans]MCM2982888.1 universal stress protein [Niallia circulans]MDR4317273.1 universal stress protein [Niallia circulans]MED3838763.1 universal stress protein [Niallia circulans]MED4245159.1 universal stress protein [Niallia circulans]
MNVNYQNIIVAVDGSDEADNAIKKAISIAKENNARLVIAHVIDTRSFATVAAYDQSIAAKSDEFANELLDKYIVQATAAGIENVVKAIEFGSPRAVVPREIATKYKADLIVCGATGLNAVERFIIGSVSEGITRNAPCDVLIVRSSDQ